MASPMYLVYSALLVAALIISIPYWIYQMVRHGKYRAGFRQRFGSPPARLSNAEGKPAVWIHAVSVGEVLAVSSLVACLREKWPECPVYVSTTTDTGQKLAQTRFGAERVFYFPMDLGFAIRPYLEALKPALIVIAETEFWPNFLRLAKASGARLAVVNARLSGIPAASLVAAKRACASGLVPGADVGGSQAPGGDRRARIPDRGHGESEIRSENRP
jgi:3-deoxy-D-manno-octulosonic-acid transferase